MKIMLASTPEQEKKIQQLVKHLYSSIFPKYFSDDEITDFIEMNFLNVSNGNLSGTLKESYQIISSLEIIISLIEANSFEIKHYREMFDKNAEILNNLGIDFPFSYYQFGKTRRNFDSASIYVKAANELLI